MQPELVHTSATGTRKIFITPGELIEGTIAEVSVNQEPFHCTIKILPKDPSLIVAEARYSAHDISLGKLKRNLVQLKYTINDVEDIIAGVESLEGRECIFRVDKSGWVSWIPRLTPKPTRPKRESEPVPAPFQYPTPEWAKVEVYFIRHPQHKSIYTMETLQGKVIGWAVGRTGAGPQAHGWVLNLATKEEAIEVLKSRKVSP